MQARRRKLKLTLPLTAHCRVGKSTVLNALLGDKFSQVSMKRTTAGINMFRVMPKEATTLSTAEHIHNVISKDNESLRSENDVSEKVFDIFVEESICKNMRNDTRLTLVDIPGINEADSSKKYKEYVQDKWNSFDCVVVVMDAIQGVNTQEQVELLEFVKQNNQSLKAIPTIVLCNKMDNPSDPNTITLVEEVRAKAIEILEMPV